MTRGAWKKKGSRGQQVEDLRQEHAQQEEAAWLRNGDAEAQRSWDDR